MLISHNGARPQVDPSAYVHSSAQVIGDVHIGPRSSIWFNAVLRGDVNYIRIGNRTNVQDNATIHVSRADCPTIIGDDVTVGHGAIVHACNVGNHCLIGIGAILLDGCHIGDNCLIGAGALVTPGITVEPGYLMLGSPAKPVRPLNEGELRQLRDSANHYTENAERYRSQGIL